MKAVLVAHGRRMESVASVDEVYEGFYARLRPLGKEGAAFLGGAEGIIGAELKMEALRADFATPDDPSASAVSGSPPVAPSAPFAAAEAGCCFVGHDGRRVAVPEGDAKARLSALRERGWQIHCVLAYVIYKVEEKSFAGEFACIAYSPALDDEARAALDVFVDNMANRIASASRPVLALTQEQFVRVIESKGTWFLTKEAPQPELPRGSVFYRRRRSLNDRLVGAALKGNKGCIVGSWLGAALIVIAIVLGVWLLFFS
jgi:hypothetical protein